MTVDATAAEPATDKSTALKPATQSTQTVDDELDLLEFLGTIDAENDDTDWLEFLRSTDIGKVAKAKPTTSRPENKGK